MENTLPQNVGSIINYLIIDQLLDINYLIINYVLKQPKGELLVAVKNNQLRTMASETVDPIDWSHPLPVDIVIANAFNLNKKIILFFFMGSTP